ncbi:MAG: ABC transporter ATP-binding protein [Clostridia bacterium]|nr:ABC transporter ATP-binding protein [Clostridia bacterium]
MTGEGRSLIEVKNLCKSYGNDFAVRDVSFTVEKGRIYGFLGPNGAGKSTVMNIITGYISASSGEVKIAGHDILAEPQKARRLIGYLPEIPPLYPDMTVREYLSFAAEIKKVNKRDIPAEVDRCMEKTDVTPMKDRLIRNLSKGYRQRVGLSQALLGDPEVVILDEPSVGLDPQQIIEMRELIASLRKDKTVILSSHILSEISAVCDMILIISNGRLIASDTPENLEELTAKDRRIEICAMCTPEEAFEALKDLSGIKCGAKAAPDGALIVLSGGSEKEMREAASKALAEKKIPVTGIVSHLPTLEDVFLKLTKEGGAE